MKRIYEVTVTTTAMVEIDDRVIKRGLGKKFEKQFYRFTTPESVAAHVSRNLVLDRANGLSGLDGFADLPDRLVEVMDSDDETTAIELKPVRVPAEKKRSAK